MGISKENFDRTFDILKDRTPEYQIALYVDSIENKDYGLFLYFWGYRGSENFKTRITEAVEEIIFLLKKQKSLNEISNAYLQTLALELLKTIDSFESVEIRGARFQYQKDAIIYLHEPERKYYSIENVENKYFDEIAKISQIRFELCKTLTNAIEEIASGTSTNNSKLQLTISVADIALLFRLLDEEKAIKVKHKTEIYKFISNSFKTNNTETISEASLKNKFLSPDNTAIKNIEILLVNLRQHLRQI